MATDIKNPWWTDDSVGAQALQMTMPRAAFERTLLRKPAATAGDAKRHEFRVLSGTHRDAVFVLGSEDLLVVGSAESCDIFLTDAGVAQRHATLSLQGRSPSIRALDGTLTVNDQPVAPSARVVLQPGAEIALGESGVKLRLAGHSEKPTAPAADKTSTSKAAETAANPSKQKSPLRRASLAALALLVPLAAGVLALEKFTPAASPANAAAQPSETPTIETLLAQENLAGKVTVSKTSYGLMLSGVLDRDAAAQLQAALPSIGKRVINSTVTQQELVEQVREVFRTRGYEVSATYLDKGRVRIDNLDENNARVQRAADEVRSDVAQLAALVLVSPTEAQPPARVPSYEAGRGERPSVQIDADTAYLSTISGSRYFVGSVLPSGHTVLRITRDAVQVERDGQISWFRF